MHDTTLLFSFIHPVWTVPSLPHPHIPHYMNVHVLIHQILFLIMRRKGLSTRKLFKHAGEKVDGSFYLSLW